MSEAQIAQKKCPRCKTVKPLEAFYRIKSRRDGRASWCKACSNSQRKHHRKSERKPSYRIVAQVVLKEGKPTTCPSCGAQNVPSHKMRGTVKDGKVTWDCIECRNRKIIEQRSILWGCGWCNEEKMVPLSEARRAFCSRECLESWREAKREAKARREALKAQEQTQDQNDNGRCEASP